MPACVGVCLCVTVCGWLHGSSVKPCSSAYPMMPTWHILSCFHAYHAALQMEMNAGRITSIGLALAGGDELQPEGPFKLGLDWVKVRNVHMLMEEKEE